MLISSYECSPCHYTCKTCLDIGKAGCDSCNKASHRKLNKIEKTCNCAGKYVDDGENEECEYKFDKRILYVDVDTK